MATLILTTVGTALGGPVGGALGAIAGRAIDGAVLRPTARQGPRLTELRVQTSSYGSEIPQLFGTIRVAGTVIWSTDLIETRSTDRGAKGGPDSVRYAYSASFAVLLSARSIRRVGRIWADGKLLRGAAGDLKVRTGFRLHTGDAGQAADPLIASAVGIDRAPAMRGQAYAVFEGMALADFGNRIPSLTFEVEADTGDVDPAAIAAAIGGGAIAAGEPLNPVLGGFSAHGGTRRAVVDMLAAAGGGWFAPTGSALALRGGAGPAVTVADEGMGGPRDVRRIASADRAPGAVTIGHYDAARDYQAGLQRAVGPGPGVRETHVELPAVLPATAAKAMAAAMLVRGEADRWRRIVAPGWSALALTPGDRVTVTGDPLPWRIVRWRMEGMAVELELTPIALATATAAAAAGEVVAAPDLLVGRTVMVAAELPPLGTDLPTRPQLTIVAAGSEPGWRGAALMLSDDGIVWRPAGEAAGPGVVGSVIVPPPATAIAAIEDRAGTIVVALANEAMALRGADDAALDAGANLALAGGELIQFGAAEQIGPTRWRLSRLWRGRRGTEPAIPAHAVGEPFALLSPESVVTIPVDAAIGATIRVAAAGVGDDEDPAAVALAITGASIVPPSPVHARVEPTTDGALRLSWIRRSRAGWRWDDRVDVPLAEERERYRINVRSSDGAVVSRIVEESAAAIESNEADAVLTVAQIGTHGASIPTPFE